MSRKVPRPLRAGDTVAIVSPASTPQPEPISRARQYLEAYGLKTKTYRDIFASHGYLAGSDSDRAQELMTAFRDPEVAAILPTRGGYGISRILDALDYELIAANPKVLIGFSDITALHYAVYTKTNVVTFHGPNLQDGLGADPTLSGFELQSYEHALLSGAAHQSSKAERERITINGAASEFQVSPGDSSLDSEVVGPLVGGNLAVLAGLVGAAYDVDTTGTILFLEDIGENPYRLDRSLAQLKLAGKLDSLAGVVLGDFTDCASEPEKPSLSLQQLFEDYLFGLGIPVLHGVSIGHCRPNLTLPFGGTARLDVRRGELTVYGEP